jgi:hypothetical protein
MFDVCIFLRLLLFSASGTVWKLITDLAEHGPFSWVDQSYLMMSFASLGKTAGAARGGVGEEVGISGVSATSDQKTSAAAKSNADASTSFCSWISSALRTFNQILILFPIPSLLPHTFQRLRMASLKMRAVVCPKAPVPPSGE